MNGKRDAELATVQRRTLIRTNLLICLILLVGFALTSGLAYRSNGRAFDQQVEQIANLVSDGAFQQISAAISQPVDVARTMAGDTLLRSCLEGEVGTPNDGGLADNLQSYLNGYRLKYGFHSVFLISSESGRYYHFSQPRGQVEEANPDYRFYFDFLSSGEEYDVQVFPPKQVGDDYTALILCRVRTDSGLTLGVVGLGVRLNGLQALLRGYEEQYRVRVCLTDRSGNVQLSSAPEGTVWDPFVSGSLSQHRGTLLTDDSEREFLWYGDRGLQNYATSRYIPYLNWHLVVSHCTGGINQYLMGQFWLGVGATVVVAALIVTVVILVLRRYGQRLLSVTISQELEYQRLLQSATEGLYENIFEWDITHNAVGSEPTRQYLQALGAERDLSYEEAIRLIADQQIKPEHIHGYLDTYAREHVLSAFQSGINNLNYDFLKRTSDGYQWIRLNARLFFWNSDQSVRMITYRQSIDAEKTREQALLQQSKQDALSELLNKHSSEEIIASTLLETGRRGHHALLLMDIDDFKRVNDSYGHAFGDQVIHAFGAELKTHFRESDIIGRVGGDEFVVLMRNYNTVPAIRDCLDRLCTRVSSLELQAHPEYQFRLSVGVALTGLHGTTYEELYAKADQALYFSKSHGKSTYTIYEESASDKLSYLVNQRDMDALINAATDGISKVACVENEFRLLYFNAARAALTGTPLSELSDPGLNVLGQIHPDDLPGALAIFHAAMPTKRAFSVEIRLQHHDGYWLPVRLRGLFVHELYEGRYPIFYAAYTNLTSQTGML